jgi:hypothetical protein
MLAAAPRTAVASAMVNAKAQTILRNSEREDGENCRAEESNEEKEAKKKG